MKKWTLAFAGLAAALVVLAYCQTSPRLAGSAASIVESPARETGAPPPTGARPDEEAPEPPPARPHRPAR